MTEELNQKANLFASIMPWNEEEDTWEDIAERAYIAGATEVTKELQERLVTIQKDDIRKAELQKREMIAEKLEYLKQVENYAIFNDDTKIMFWASCMKSEIIQELQNGNFVLTVNEIIEGKDKRIAELEKQIEKMKNCRNCANCMISDKCPRFFRTGWCKNWEMTRSKK